MQTAPHTRPVEPDAPDVEVRVRGTAPKGTFQIPEGGLRLPAHDSFLARFQTRSTNGKLYPLATSRTANESQDAFSSSPPASEAPTQPQIQSNIQHPETVPGTAVTATAATTATTATTSTKTALSSIAATSAESKPASRSASIKASLMKAAAFLTAESMPVEPAADPVTKETHEHESDSQSDNQSDNLVGSLPPPLQLENEPSSFSKTLEQVADEEEDTLINVLPDKDSLLYDGRPSYNSLRFCSANALLNQKMVDKLGLPMGFTWTPFGELLDIPRLEQSPPRCKTCTSFLAKGNGNEDVQGGAAVWTCAFCQTDNDATGIVKHLTNDKTAHPELFVDTFDYVHGDTSMTPVSSKKGAIVLIVDENVDDQEAEWARAATAAVHKSASARGLQFLLMVVGTTCSVMTQSSTSGKTPALETISPTLAAKLTPREKSRFFLDALPTPTPQESTNGHIGANGTVPDAKLHSGDQAPTDAAVVARVQPYARQGGDVDPPSTTEEDAEATEKRPRSTRLPPELESRRLDLALQVAFELLTGKADIATSRILSLITGAPTTSEARAKPDDRNAGNIPTATSQPPGTDTTAATTLAKVYERVGARAGELHLALDVLVFGAPQAFSAQVLLAAVKRSRGGVVHCAAHAYSSASAIADAATHLVEKSTNTGMVSIRASAPLAVARVIGPAFPTTSAHTYTIPGADRTIGFTVVLKGRGEAEEVDSMRSHAVVQLAAKSGATTRVMTARIPMADTIDEYLRGLDAEICALVLGKACVVSGGGLIKPDVVAKAIDKAVKQLMEGSEACAGIVRLLYELRRGTLVEEQLDNDQSLLLRSMFLRAEHGLASLLMSPRLFTNAVTDESTGLMGEVPLEKTQITSDAVLVLDSGLNIFIYVAEGASAEAEEAISTSAVSAAGQRTSPCQLWKLQAGQDADFILDTYLSDSDKDRAVRRAKKGVHRGFVGYCTSVAPGSILVRALRRGNV